MATKRVNEGGHVDGEDSNELPSVVENAGTAAASGARRVVALLQDHATGRRMPVHAGDALDAVVAAAAAAGFPPNVVLCAVPAVATSASNLVAALGQHQLEFIERRTIARGPEDARGAKYSYKQRTCVVCKSPNAAHYCTAPSCGLAVVLCGAYAKRCRDAHVHAALNGLANAPAATSADAAAAFYGLAGGAFAGAVGGNSGGKRPRRSASASGPVAALDPALTAHHRLDFIERRVLPAQIGPGGSSSSGPRYSYKQRTCVVCKSPNAAHYCTACGPQVVLCGNSAKGCYATHVLSIGKRLAAFEGELAAGVGAVPALLATDEAGGQTSPVAPNMDAVSV